MLLEAVIAAVVLQTPPSTPYYELRFYQSAPAPVQSQPITNFLCGQPKFIGGSTINPTTVAIDDPADVTKDCLADQTTTLFSLPIGDYVGRIVLVTDAGPSGESNSAPFARASPAPSPTNLRIVRPPG